MRMMTCREASEELQSYGVTKDRIKRGCLEGKYPHIRIGNRILVDVDMLEEIVSKEMRNKDDLLSTQELAQRVGLSESSIRRAVADGWIPCEIVGRNMRFRLIEVQEAIERKMGERYNG